MLRRAALREQMHDLDAVRDQPIGNVCAVTMSGIALGTHQANGLVPIGQPSRGVAE